MGTYIRRAGWALLSLMALVGSTTSAAPLDQHRPRPREAWQTTDPLAVTTAFFTAVNTAAYDQIRQLVDPTTRFISDPGTPLAREHDLPGFIEDAQFVQLRLLVTRLTRVDAETVVAAYTINAQYLLPLPHPYTAQATLTIHDGRITGWVSRFSAQTVADLTGAQPPGMPRSGNPQASLPAQLLVLGWGCATVGYLVRRRTTAQAR